MKLVQLAEKKSFQLPIWEPLHHCEFYWKNKANEYHQGDERLEDQGN